MPKLKLVSEWLKLSNPVLFSQYIHFSEDYNAKLNQTAILHKNPDLQETT